jgi:arginyl-tRNA synthetase
MSRAERKKQIMRILDSWDKSHKGHTMNMGMIARRMGIKSSTHLRNIIQELIDDGWVVPMSTAPNKYGQTFRSYKIARYNQMPLPDHTIKIGGVEMMLKHSEG